MKQLHWLLGHYVAMLTSGKSLVTSGIKRLPPFLKAGCGALGNAALRLIRINERSAGGDPLAEFPKGNSLWRLQGGFVCPRWSHAPAMRVALVEAASADRHGERSSRVLVLCADARVQSASGSPGCAARRHFSAIGHSGLYV
jgi:hypothetical protein